MSMASLPLRSSISGPTQFSLARAPVWFSSALLATLMIVPTYDFRPAADANFGLDPQLFLRLGICMVCGLYGITYWRASYSFLLSFPGAWVLILCGWATLTIPVAESPAYAAASSLVLWCVALFVPAVLAQLGKRRVLLTLFASLAVFLVLACVLYVLVPSIGRSAYLVDGEIQYRVGKDAQQLGLQSVWLIVVSLVLGMRRELRPALVAAAIGVAIVTIGLAQSRTSLVAAVVVLAFAFLTRARRQHILAGWLLAVAIGSAVLWGYACGLFTIHGTEVLSSISRTGTQEEIFNVTGRTEFWPYVLQKIGESPLWGHGYGCARQALYGFNGEGYSYGELHHAHNTILNTALTTGFVGVMIFCAMLLSLFDGLLRKRELFPSIAFLAVAVCGLTESLLFGPMPRSHTVLWIFALYWHQSGLSKSKNSDELVTKGAR